MSAAWVGINVAAARDAFPGLVLNDERTGLMGDDTLRGTGESLEGGRSFFFSWLPVNDLLKSLSPAGHLASHLTTGLCGVLLLW